MRFRAHPIAVVTTLLGVGLGTMAVLAQDQPRPRQEQDRGQAGEQPRQAQQDEHRHQVDQQPGGRTTGAMQRQGQAGASGTGRGISSAQDAAQARRMMETHGVSLGDAIRTAEQHCNGKAVYAEIMLASSSGQGRDTMSRPGDQTGQQQPGMQNRQESRQDPGQDAMRRTDQASGQQQPGMQARQQEGGQPGQAGAGQLVFQVYCANEQNQLALVMVDGQSGQVRDTRTVASIQREGGMAGMSQERQARSTRSPIERSAEFHFIRGSDVMGADIKNAQDENLGNLSNLAVSDEGQIAYAVMSSGGVLGLGAELRAVPWNALQFRENDEFMLNIDQEALKRAGGFKDESWPRTADATLRGRTTPGQQEFRPAGMAENATFTWRGDNLIGKPILDNRNEQIGTINDIAVDARRGFIGYVIVGYGGVAGVGDKLVAVPWNAFDRSAKEGFRLNVDKSRLESAPGIEDDWSMLTNRDFAMRTHQHFNARPYWMEGGEGTQQDLRERDMQQREMPRDNRTAPRRDENRYDQQRDAGRGSP